MARLADQLTGRRWRDKNGAERSMEPADVLIVTPYNAQIRAIQRALAASGQAGFRVGTVDKFQGQEPRRSFTRWRPRRRTRRLAGLTFSTTRTG